MPASSTAFLPVSIPTRERDLLSNRFHINTWMVPSTAAQWKKLLGEPGNLIQRLLVLNPQNDKALIRSPISNERCVFVKPGMCLNQVPTSDFMSKARCLGCYLAVDCARLILGIQGFQVLGLAWFRDLGFRWFRGLARIMHRA